MEKKEKLTEIIKGKFETGEYPVNPYDNAYEGHSETYDRCNKFYDLIVGDMTAAEYNYDFNNHHIFKKVCGMWWNAYNAVNIETGVRV